MGKHRKRYFRTRNAGHPVDPDVDSVTRLVIVRWVTIPYPTSPLRRLGRGFFLRWHWLSLDAVTALMSYQWAVQEAADVALPAWLPVFLGVGIWCGYSADRLIDVARAPHLADISARHAFHQRHHAMLSVAWLVLVMALTTAGWMLLPQRAFVGGAFVAILAAVYVWMAPRRGGGQSGWRGGKRLSAVAILTLAGVWWALWVIPKNLPATLGMMGAFALAAWWSLSFLHHRLVQPLSWYRPSAAACAFGIISLAILCFETGRVALPVAFIVASIFASIRFCGAPEANGLGALCPETGESLLPPLIDGALAASFLLFGWVL